MTLNLYLCLGRVHQHFFFVFDFHAITPALRLAPCPLLYPITRSRNRHNRSLAPARGTPVNSIKQRIRCHPRVLQ